MAVDISSVNQSSAQAQGDVVAGDKNSTTYIQGGTGPTVIDQLVERLRDEVDRNTKTRQTIESLARFQKQRSVDGIVGLEAKLQRAGRQDEIFDALEMKELFAKLLETWALYNSAQEILAFLLAKAEYEFNHFIRPQVDQLNQVQINELIKDKVIEPTTAAWGGSVLVINHSEAMGMVYWLAEQCFVRWHK